MLDCNLVNRMFTEPQLLAIGAALTTLAVAAAGMAAAYVTRITHKWLTWTK